MSHGQHGQTCLSVSRHRPSVPIRTTSVAAPTPAPSNGRSIPRPPPLAGLLPSLQNRSTDCLLISGRAEPASCPHQPLLQHPAAPEDGISQLPLQLSVAWACTWQFIWARSQVRLADSPGQGRPPGAVGPALGGQSRQRGGLAQQPHGEELVLQSRLLSEKEVFICRSRCHLGSVPLSPTMMSLHARSPAHPSTSPRLPQDEPGPVTPQPHTPGGRPAPSRGSQPFT